MSAALDPRDPHRGHPLLHAGKALSEARVAMVMVHGRGATAESILELAAEFHHPDVAYLAPQASGNTWYPQSFLAEISRNEPWLSSALAALRGVMTAIAAAGVPRERTILLGFSQGACLSLELGAREGWRLGGVVGLSGGLIGPPGTPRDYPGGLGGTPVFLGCSDRDPHIPLERVEETAEVLARMGGEVEMRIYPNFGHSVNEDELAWIRELLARL